MGVTALADWFSASARLRIASKIAPNHHGAGQALVEGCDVAGDITWQSLLIDDQVATAAATATGFGAEVTALF